MLRKLKKRLKSLVSEEPVDPSIFEDPIALKAEWTPLEKGGANFKTHTLKVSSDSRIEYLPDRGAILFYSLFIGAGILSLFIPLFNSFFGEQPVESNSANIVLPIIFFAGFSAAGWFLRHRIRKPILFDKDIGLFWKGYKKPNEVINLDELEVYLPLAEVHAIQLLSERCSSSSSNGGSSSYYSYELNIVTNDGRRYSVMDHGKKDKIRLDASTIASFLDVKVWDGIRS